MPDEESQSLYYMYGFKTNENNIQDVFKFEPATRNMFISENCKLSYSLKLFRV